MRNVYISQRFEPNLDAVSAALSAGAQALGGVDQLLAGCQRVLVKPNICFMHVRDKANTSPNLIEAVLALLADHGIPEVILGEARGADNDAQEMFEAMGLVEIAARYGARLADLNRSQMVDLPVPNGLRHEAIPVAEEAATADLILNLPALKTHAQATMSVAMKNMKGVLDWPTKRRFHRIGLYESIVDLYHLGLPQLVVVDGTRAMEGWGPSDGDPVAVDRLIMGSDPLAVDQVSAQVMGMAFEDVPYVRMALEGAGVGAPQVLGAAIEAVQADLGRPFELAPLDLMQKLPFATITYGPKYCTGCQGTVSSGCSYIESSDWTPSREAIDWAIGEAVPPMEGEGRIAVAFGLCAIRAARAAGLEESERLLFAVGCPPGPDVGFALLEVIKAAVGE